MESITSPPQSHKPSPTYLIKSSSKLAQMSNMENDDEIPHFSVEFVPSPKKTTTPLTTPSKLSINKPRNLTPLHELLLMSPPVRKSRTRLSDRLEMADEAVEPRKRCKGRTSSIGLSGCASPRGLRRSRRRVEHEDREFVQVEEVLKPKKRRQSGKSRKEKNCSVPSAPPSNDRVGEESALDRLGQTGWELVMWTDVAKSSLWFGFGCLCFMSSCFTKGLNISLFSVVSQLGLLLLAASFISNTLLHRENAPTTREVKLTEDDILRVIRVVLPAINLMILKTRELFSGEPSTTLKVAILFLFGAEYGHLLTLWRLCTLGFFASFTAPKLFSLYSAQIHSQAEQCKRRVLEAWRACSHKKIVALSVTTAFWNLSSLRTRFVAAFVSLVILRYYRQNIATQLENEEIKLEQSQAAVEKREKEETEHEQEQIPAQEKGVKNLGTDC